MTKASISAKIGGGLDSIHGFLCGKRFLLIAALLIATCSSFFAFKYGLGLHPAYGVLFSVALLLLTFHFAKSMHWLVLWCIKFVAIVGLVVVTVFVLTASFLAVGTQKADPELAAINDRIAKLESDKARYNLRADAILASGNPVNSREYSDTHVAPIASELNKLYADQIRLVGKQSNYESGAMAIFGHIKKVVNRYADREYSQEFVSLSVTWALLLILVCVELSIGADITGQRSRPKDGLVWGAIYGLWMVAIGNRKWWKKNPLPGPANESNLDNNASNRLNGSSLSSSPVIESEKPKKSTKESVLRLFGSNRRTNGSADSIETQSDAKKKTRSTGLDRPKAKQIIRHIETHSDSQIGMNYVQQKFGVGRQLIRDIYAHLVQKGIIERDGKTYKKVA